MKNTVFPHKFWRPFLDCMPQLFFRPQYVWFPVHLKGHLIPLCYETLVVNWQNWLFTLFHQSRSVLSPNPIASHRMMWDAITYSCLRCLLLTPKFSYDVNSLRPSNAYTHQHINRHWFRYWLVSWPTSSHYLNQCCNIVNWNLGNKLQWNPNHNSYIFIQGN